MLFDEKEMGWRQKIKDNKSQRKTISHDNKPKMNAKSDVDEDDDNNDGDNDDEKKKKR